MMQPMFPEGDSNVDRWTGAAAVVVETVVADDVVVLPGDTTPEDDAVDVATDDPVVAGAVTVTVLDDPPQPTNATANATTTPGTAVFTGGSLAETPEGVGSLYEHDYRSR